MKRLILIGMVAFGVLVTSCNEAPAKTDDCMHCMGCFSSWDECESGYRPTEANPMSWAEYKNSMISNAGGGTWYCEQVN